MKTLLYTFRTYPYLDDFQNSFVLGKLKEDLEILFEKITEDKPSRILGIADNKNKSVTEPIALNKFNNGIIKKEGEDLNLDLLEGFEISNKPTHSFCNYTAYKIQEFIKSNNLPIKHSFIHLNKKDIRQLNDFLIT